MLTIIKVILLKMELYSLYDEYDQYPIKFNLNVP